MGRYVRDRKSLLYANCNAFSSCLSGITPSASASAGTTQLNLTLAYKTFIAPLDVASPLTITITVNGLPVPRGGDDDLARNTRLHWLNADAGRGAAIPAPFGPVKVTGSTVNGSFFSLEVG